MSEFKPEISDFKPNSHKYKESTTKSLENKVDKKPVEKVVKTPAKVKKKTVFNKFTDLFVSDTAFTAKNYIVDEVIIPAVKSTIEGIVTNGISILLYGEAGHTRRRSSSSNKVSYSGFYDKPRERSEPAARSSFNYDELTYDTRGEAEDVLFGMRERIDEYGMVSIADLYDLSGVSCPYTFHRYGWTNLRTAEIARCRDGWEIRLPRALPIV